MTTNERKRALWPACETLKTSEHTVELRGAGTHSMNVAERNLQPPYGETYEGVRVRNPFR